MVTISHTTVLCTELVIQNKLEASQGGSQKLWKSINKVLSRPSNALTAQSTWDSYLCCRCFSSVPECFLTWFEL